MYLPTFLLLKNPSSSFGDQTPCLEDQQPIEDPTFVRLLPSLSALLSPRLAIAPLEQGNIRQSAG